jgi:hypothetical protein
MGIDYQIHNAVVKIDEDDLDRVKSKKWYVVGKSIRTSTGLRLSHFIAGKPPKGLVKAHWDGDFLNNTKENLKDVTQTVNMSRDLRDKKGYYFCRERRLWCVSIGVDGRAITEEDLRRRNKQHRLLTI